MPRDRSKSRTGKIIFFHCGKSGHLKRVCCIWKQEQQKVQKQTNTSKKSTSTNEGETTAIVSYDEVLFSISMEYACLCTSSNIID